MNCASCHKELHPTDERQTSLSGEVLCVACVKKLEPRDE